MTDGNKVRVTLKGGTSYDAPWITIDGVNIADALEQLANKEQVKELIDATAKVGQYFASTGKPSTAGAAPKRFENGRVVAQQADGAPEVVNDQCPHGRKHFAKDNWEAMFCTERERANQCPPAFKDKKTGKYLVKS
ncbi:hypothetical protein [Streptomyces noursei]|uniref:hypothetical protein n=1 Tax=Streptomyces noursei TaxID=1971 RepID=UPI00167B90AC|nr:hypothetical protein [Streptomyces noursei]MCZ1015586.1 hypothetical protein [Streptomyces noursei]